MMFFKNILCIFHSATHMYQVLFVSDWKCPNLMLKLSNQLRLWVWIAVRPTENDSTQLYKIAISQLLLGVAGSNLVGRKAKCYFIIHVKFSLLLSIRLCQREIRPDASKTTER